jgi:hypothetical protein
MKCSQSLRGNVGSGAAAAPPATPKGRKGKQAIAVEAAVDGHVLGALDVERVAKLYVDTFNDFMAKKNRVRSITFLQLCRVQPTVGWHVARAFIAGVTGGKNEFLKGQAMTLFQELIPRQSAAGSLPEGAVAGLMGLALAGAANQLSASAVEGAEVKVKFVRDTLGFSSVVVKTLSKLSGGGADVAEFITSLKAVLASGLVAQSAPVKNMSTQILRSAEALANGEVPPAKSKGGKANAAVAAAEAPPPSSTKKKGKKRKGDSN